MTWSKNYKKSIDCNNPKGFSQKAHCRARKLRQMGKKTKSEPVNEDLRNWFREKWVNIAKKKKGGGYEPCGTSGKKKGYAKCVPAAKAASMSKDEIKSAVRRKRAAQAAAGRPGKDQPGQGNKPIMVKTMKEEILQEKNKPTNPKLWARAKSLARSKFDVYPSAYANGWAAKWYRGKGGGWRSTNEELGKENEWGTPELTKKMLAVTPGQENADIPVLKKKVATLKEFLNIEQETAIYHGELNPAAWDGMKLKPDVREALLKVARTFIETWGVDLEVTDIILTGSNANFNWTKFSDFDLHVIVRLGGYYDVTLVEKLLRSKKDEFNRRHNIRIKGYPVEVYAQGSNEHLVATGQYSLQADNWLVEPRISAPSFEHKEIGDMADALIKEAQDAIAGKNVDMIKLVLEKIAGMRKSGLSSTGEFGLQNMVFKVVRNSGMIEKLRQALVDLSDEELSLDEAAPAWQRKEGKNPEGGLNRKGIASYRRANPGSKLSMAVTTKPSKLKKGSKSWKRRKSFCARMSGMKKRLTSAKTARDPDSRINKALRKWNC